MNNLNQLDSVEYTEHKADPTIIGRCYNCYKNHKVFTILTSDYQTFKDRHDNLFCSEECALEYYGVEEYDG